MPRYSYINGAYVPHAQAQIHIEDRGFQFADGVYEVISLIEGMYADERGHLDRLERSLSELEIEMPMSRKSLRMIMRELVRRNKARNALIYIQITRGVAKRDFPFPDPAPSPSLVLTARPFDFTGNQAVKEGINVITVPDIRWKRPDIKSVSLLPQVLAKQQAIRNEAKEAWMVDEEGYITEGASSNAWIYTNEGKLVTRDTSARILNGVTRTALKKLCESEALSFEERPFTKAEACEAVEAINSSAGALIVPVISIDGNKIGKGTPGPVARKLYDIYMEYVKKGEGAQLSWSP